MNMFLRVLIVIANFVLVPIMFPIQAVKLVVMYFKDKEEFNEYDIYWADLVDAFVQGIGIGLKSNAKFLKNGDLNEFDWAFKDEGLD